jgi:hypothetical protein
MNVNMFEHEHLHEYEHEHEPKTLSPFCLKTLILIKVIDLSLQN